MFCGISLNQSREIFRLRGRQRNRNRPQALAPITPLRNYQYQRGAPTIPQSSPRILYRPQKRQYPQHRRYYRLIYKRQQPNDLASRKAQSTQTETRFECNDIIISAKVEDIAIEPEESIPLITPEIIQHTSTGVSFPFLNSGFCCSLYTSYM